MTHLIPDDIGRPAGRRQILITWLCVLLVILLSNLGASIYLKRYSTNLGYRLIQAKWQMLLSLTAPVDSLVLGDSSGNQSVAAGPLGEALSGLAINLCTIADALAANDAWMLETYIAKFGAPRRVFLVHAYDMWHRELDATVLAQIPLSWGYWSHLQPHMSLSIRAQASLLLQKQVPLYYENKSLSLVLREPWMISRRQLRLDPHGFMPTQGSEPIRVLSDAESHLNFVREHRPMLSAPNIHALRHMVTLAERHTFQLYLVNSPIYHGLYENDAFRSYLLMLERQLLEVLGRTPRAHYIFPIPVRFGADEMQNADHLTETAARVFTRRLVEAVHDIETPSR
jgi:hypothetical protein